MNHFPKIKSLEDKLKGLLKTKEIRFVLNESECTDEDHVIWVILKMEAENGIL